MITREETNLTVAQYAALQAATGDPSIAVTIEQYTPIFGAHDSDGILGAAVDCFDAIVCGDVLVRAYYTAVNTLTIDTLANEDGGDQSWVTQNLVATNIVSTVPVVLAESGNVVRAFYYDGTNIKYFESLDEGTNWGAIQQVGAKANVIFLGAATLFRVHYLTTTALDNCRMGVAIFNGAWALTDGGIYWPFVPDCFDVVSGSPTDEGAVADCDIFCMTTDFPPIIGAKIQSTELVRELHQVQGLAFLRYQNGHYSSHWEFDLIDRAPSFPSRTAIRLSHYEDWLFACYYRRDGTVAYPHPAMALSRSKDGKFWELPYLFGAWLDAPSIMLKRGGHVYVLNAWQTYRCFSTGYNGDAQMTQDVTAYLSQISIKQGAIAQCDLALENPADVLDAPPPLATFANLQTRLELGYNVVGEDLKIQTFLGDVDVRGGSKQVPTTEMSLASRDYLARLMMVQADQVQEWDGHVVGGDLFEAGTDNTDYSGLRHTAIQDGAWKAPAGDNELVLIGSLCAGVAFNTYCMDAWNGECQSGFQVGATTTDDFAGLLFRAYDKNHFLCVKYDAETDTIKLYDRKDDVDYGLAESGAMGWATETWYWLKLRFLYSKVYIYSSVDGISWTEEIDSEIAGMAAGVSWTWDNFLAREIPNLSGRMGYLGHGYSDYDDVFPDPPPPLPDESDPPGSGDIGESYKVFGANGAGVFYTDDINAVAPAPNFVSMNTGLDATGAKFVYDLKIMNWSDGHKTLFAGTRCGIYEYTNLPAPGGAWQKRITNDEVALFAGISTYTHMYFSHINVSLEREGWMSCYFLSWRQSGINQYEYYSGVVTSRDGFQHIHTVAILKTEDLWMAQGTQLGSVKYAQHSNGLTIYVAESSYSVLGRAARLHRSLDGGATFSIIDTYDQGVNGSYATTVYVPYHSEDHDDAVIWWGCYNRIRHSDDGGASFSTWLSAGPWTTKISLGGPSHDKTIFDQCLMTQFFELAGGVNSQFLPNWTPPGVASSFFVMRRFFNLRVEKLLWAGSDAGPQAKIYLVEGGVETVATGDYNTVSGGGILAEINTIARWEYESVEM